MTLGREARERQGQVGVLGPVFHRLGTKVRDLGAPAGDRRVFSLEIHTAALHQSNVECRAWLVTKGTGLMEP